MSTLAKAAGRVSVRRHWDSESPDSEQKEPLQSFLLAFSLLTVKEGWSRRDKRGNMGLLSAGRWVEKERNIGNHLRRPVTAGQRSHFYTTHPGPRTVQLATLQ